MRVFISYAWENDLLNGGTLEHVDTIANHESSRTTKCYI